jgi:hypothetical protein
MSLDDLTDAELLDTRYLTKKPFARAIKASDGHVNNKLAAGELPAVKDGKRVLISITPREYLESRPKFVPRSGGMKAGPGRPHKAAG